VTYRLKEKGDKALVAFLTASYPDAAMFRGLVRAADAAGCDLIEIGIPFSDPIADGPLIQESSQRALDNGATLASSLQAAGELAQEIAAPLLVMSYYNPILRMGVECFGALAARSRIAGAIVPDVPFEESDRIRSVLAENGVTYVDFVAPTSGTLRPWLGSPTVSSTSCR
jgi:tryptophan synthase alpha chain